MNPGLHFRDISRKMNIPKSTLEHHIRFLLKRELINAKSSGRYKRYHVKEINGRDEEKILNILREEIPRKIILTMLFSIGISIVELSKQLNKTNSTTAFHLKKLQNADIIEPAQIGAGFIYRPKNRGTMERKSAVNEKIYILKDPDMIYKLLISTRDSLHDDTVDEIIDHIEYWLSHGGYPRKLPSFNFSIDNAVEVFNEIFPNPICA
jgi:predicted transcriptional regulator